MKRIRIIAGGRVQGVGFRCHAAEEARRYSTAGYVQNLYDGRVEIDAEGEQADIHCFLEVCQKGSLRSRIDTFLVSEVSFYGFKRFEIK